MAYTEGSIICAQCEHFIELAGQSIQTRVKTLSVVTKIEGSSLYCGGPSLVSVNGEAFKPTSEVYPDYQGETTDTVRLVDQNEFDILYDTVGRGILL